MGAEAGRVTLVPTRVRREAPSRQDWADIAKLPDWSGVWNPKITDQDAQIKTNPPPWNEKAKKQIDFMHHSVSLALARVHLDTRADLHRAQPILVRVIPVSRLDGQGAVRVSLPSAAEVNRIVDPADLVIAAQA